MTPDEYQKLALRTEKTPLFMNDAEGKPSELLSRVMHGAMGMVTEAGELMDMLKKHVIYGKPFDPVNVLEEAGDKMWYAAIVLHACGFGFEEALERNIAKLRARYGDKFSEERALTRDLDAERATLEAKPAPTNQEISDLCHSLKSILDDPHPGLTTWHSARYHVAEQLLNALRAVIQ